jgi:hypothetical protein
MFVVMTHDVMAAGTGPVTSDPAGMKGTPALKRREAHEHSVKECHREQ